jgi:hypothetical protein
MKTTRAKSKSNRSRATASSIREQIRERYQAGETDEALALGLTAWKSLKDRSTLDAGGRVVALLIGAILHEQGDDVGALGYLHRYTVDADRDAASVDEPLWFAWGDALYQGIALTVKMQLLRDGLDPAFRPPDSPKTLEEALSRQMPAAKKAPSKGEGNGKTGTASAAGCSTMVVAVVSAVSVAAIAAVWLI